MWTAAGLPPTIYMAMDNPMSWLSWADFANKVYHFWLLVKPQLCERPEDKPRVRLPAEVVEETPEVGPRGMVYPEAPFQLGPHLRVVRHETYLRCLDCSRQTGKVKGEYNFSYHYTHECSQEEEGQDSTYRFCCAGG
eukprot:469064-Amphidinium_carterae.1